MRRKILKIVMVALCIIAIILPIYAESEYKNIEAKVVKVLGTEEVQKENGIKQKVQNLL